MVFTLLVGALAWVALSVIAALIFAHFFNKD